MRTRARRTRRRLEEIASTATLGGLFLSMFKVGLIGFGGGYAVIAQIRALVVHQRRWMSDREFSAGFVLGQTLPGTVAGNVASYVGLRLRGWRGAVVSICGFVLPSMLLMILLAILYRHLRYLPSTDLLFHGLNAAVVAVVFVTAWRMARNAVFKPWQWIVGIVSCTVVAFFGATVLEVVLISGVVGIFLDAFAEKQLYRLRVLRTIANRRRRRIAARLKVQRRSRRYHERYFAGISLTRTLADERVRKAAEEARKRTIKPVSKSVLPLLVTSPAALLAKFGILVLLATIFFRVGAITFGG